MAGAVLRFYADAARWRMMLFDYWFYYNVVILLIRKKAAVAEMHDARYPVGKPSKPAVISLADRQHAVEVLAAMPGRLREALHGLDAAQLDTPYREGGWTVRQVVHHVADSHMTAFHRIRRALTEDVPTVQGYDEKAFATLPDMAGPTEWSAGLIEALHARMVMMLQGLDEAQWQRTYNHAERGASTMEETVLLYAWHSRHHVAHITQLRIAKGW